MAIGAIPHSQSSDYLKQDWLSQKYNLQNKEKALEVNTIFAVMLHRTWDHSVQCKGINIWPISELTLIDLHFNFPSLSCMPPCSREIFLFNYPDFPHLLVLLKSMLFFEMKCKETALSLMSDAMSSVIFEIVSPKCNLFAHISNITFKINMKTKFINATESSVKNTWKITKRQHRRIFSVYVNPQDSSLPPAWFMMAPPHFTQPCPLCPAHPAPVSQAAGPQCCI